MLGHPTDRSLLELLQEPGIRQQNPSGPSRWDVSEQSKARLLNIPATDLPSEVEQAAERASLPKLALVDAEALGSGHRSLIILHPFHRTTHTVANPIDLGLRANPQSLSAEYSGETCPTSIRHTTWDCDPSAMTL